MKIFKNVCTGVGFVVICFTGTIACLALSGKAKLSITGRDGKTIYDNSDNLREDFAVYFSI